MNLGKELERQFQIQILNALKAKYVFKLNKDYIVLNNKILIVDEFTGRIMEDRRWSLGIHEAVETKEKVEVGTYNISDNALFCSSRKLKSRSDIDVFCKVVLIGYDIL